MALKTRVSSTWVEPTPKVRVGGTWVTPSAVKVREGGSWVTVWPSGPSVVVAPTKLISDLETQGSTAYAYVRVDSDGDLKQYTGVSYSTYETWLDSGLNSQVWVERTIISGSLDVDSGTGRLACTSSRTFGVSRGGIGVTSCTIDLKFYDAASGGNLLDTQRVTLTAEIENPF